MVAANALAFIVLFALSIRFMRQERSKRVRNLWMVVALVTGALVVGATQRLALQGSTLGLLPGSVTADVVEGWQLVQSLVVLTLVLMAFGSVRRLAASMAASERIAGSILDRVGHIDVGVLDLTRREEEVLSAIGSGLLTDAELAKELHISANTVQTHVKRLLRKTSLNRRQDLMAVSYLRESAHH